MRTAVIDPHDESVFRRFHEIMWRAETEDGRKFVEHFGAELFSHAAQLVEVAG